MAIARFVRQVRDHAMFVVDLQGRCASWNEGVGAILGWDEADWIGQPVAVAFTPEDVADGVPERELRQAARTGSAHDDRWLQRRDGERFFANGSVSPVRDEAGAIVAFLKVLRDGTDARRTADECERALAAERTLRAQSERQAAVLRATIAAIPDALYIGNADGITECNAQALQMLGVASLDELRARIDELGRRFRVRRERDGDLVAAQDLPFARALNGEMATLETWATRPDGEDVFIRGTAAPIRVDGHILGAVAINSDLTHRVRLDERQRELAQVKGLLAEREEAFRALVRGVRDYAIFTIGLDGRISSWHIGAQLMKGYTAEQAIGMPFADLFTPEDRAAGRPQLEMDMAVRTGEFKGEGRRLRQDGTAFEAAVVLTALRGPDDGLLGYLKLTQDITRRKQVEAEREEMLSLAQAARADAERASHSKGEFLAVISHELRTPLGAILGWAHLLERGVADPHNLQQGLAAIRRNAQVQVQLIEDLLDMSRIESGQMRLETGPVDITGVVAAAVEAVQPNADHKDLTVHTLLDPRAGPVMGDPARLQQIVWNLLSNAVKFTPAGGRVTVSVTRVRGHLEIAVADTGQGMEREFLTRAFHRFQQQDASSTRRFGGLGLGLAIVRQLTELHGGSVRADSAGPGKGSTFTVRLPALGRERGNRTAAAEAPAPLPGPPVHEQDHRLDGVDLLVIDDEPDGRAVAAYALQAAGARVVTAGSAEEGLQRFQAHRPAAVLCDIGMPVHDGYAFIRWMRQAEAAQGRHTPAAAFTAFARPEDRQRAIEAGYQHHLVKPLAPSALVDAVVALLQRESGDTAGDPGTAGG
ncbi:PAS domain S-box protein [Aquabacterium sp. J223]|uniref:hybrid sensor histidine kinase/response regulator n=1 Tax=Aquabacterium sp. J223 TaxID=2898431 RepID=UPI0021ADE0C1|nr:PAS domain S-box protein [Aquabacterium sp. J223]UUX94410.1 PAS domain S-box protein [Aquabacterium sp. J223]